MKSARSSMCSLSDVRPCPHATGLRARATRPGTGAGKGVLQLAERQGAEPRGGGGPRGRRLQGAAARLRPLRHRRGWLGRGQPALADRVAAGLEHVAQRRTEVHQLDVGQPGPRQPRPQHRRVVAAEVPDHLVGRAEPLLPGRRREQQPAAGPQVRRPLGQRAGVVLDVLDHLERAPPGRTARPAATTDSSPWRTSPPPPAAATRARATAHETASGSTPR